MAALWGTSAYGDIFFLAFKIPNLLRRFFAEGAMSSAFIPLFSKMPLERSEESSENLENSKILPRKPDDPMSKQEFYFTIFWLLAATMIGVVLLGIAFSGPIASFLFILQDFGFDKTAETSLLLKILFPYIGFISLCSLQQGVLENHGRFAYSASVPVLFNLITIITVTAVLWVDRGNIVIELTRFAQFTKYLGFSLSGHPDVRELSETILVSLGVLVGGAGQLGYSFWGANRLGYRIWPFAFMAKDRSRKLREYFRHPVIKKFFLLILPVFLSSGSYQIQVILSEPIALSLGEGAVSTLYYATRLLEFPLGIVGVALTTASLPLLSKAAVISRADLNHADRDESGPDRFTAILHQTLNSVFILFLPVLMVSFFYPETIISLVFEFRHFTRQDTLNTALCFLYLIPSLFALSGYRIFFNAFYARENTRLPLLISSISLFIGVPLSYLLTRLYPHPAMIALASTISAYLMLAVSLILLQRLGVSMMGFLWERLLFYLKVAGLVLLPSYLVFRLMSPIFQVLEKTADNFWMVKLIYAGKLGFFSLWVFGLMFTVLILLREPQMIKFVFRFSSEERSAK